MTLRERTEAALVDPAVFSVVQSQPNGTARILASRTPAPGQQTAAIVVLDVKPMPGQPSRRVPERRLSAQAWVVCERALRRGAS